MPARFLMCPPIWVSNREPNNPWMDSTIKYDRSLAYDQWHNLYRRIASDHEVYLLPAWIELQDQPFVANLGCVINETLVLSNFTSKPRKGEEASGIKFFDLARISVRQPPYRWEGEADLKHIRDNLYVGATGQRSTAQAYKWMEEEFGIEVVTVALPDPKLYHLDCVFLPINDRAALVNTDALFPGDVSKLEKIVEVIDVPKEYKYDSWTNSLVLGQTILTGSSLDLQGFNIERYELSEFEKSGADLSCLVMSLD